MPRSNLPTSNASKCSDTFESQATSAVPNNAAEAPQTYHMNYNGSELPPSITQTLQQIPSADRFAVAHDHSSTSEDYDLDPDFGDSLLNKPDFSF